MSVEESMFKEAMAAIDAGENSRARDLLTRLLKDNPNNAQYWLWMSAVVETRKECIYSLKEAYRLDPQNVAAKRGLMMYGEIEPDPSLALPYKYQKHDWESELRKSQASAVKKQSPLARSLVYGGLILLVAAVGVAALWYFHIFSRPNADQTFVNINRSTATPSATPSIKPRRATPTPTGPTPLWMMLQATYTPTPLFLETPHVAEAYSLGMEAFQKRNWDQAITYFQQALETEYNSNDIRYYIGESYRLKGDYANANDMFNTIIKRNSSFAPAYLGRARTEYYGLSNWRDAVTDLKEAIRFDSTMGQAYLEMACVFDNQGDGNSALGYLETAEPLVPDSPLFYYYRGWAEFLTDDNDSALKDILKANSMDSTIVDMYLLLGKIYQATGDYQSSIKPLTTYITYDSTDYKGYLYLGRGYYAINDYDNTIQTMTQALALNNTVFEAYEDRADSYMKINNPQSALADFISALAIDPKSFDANMGRGQALMAQNEYRLAYVQFNVADAYDKTDTESARLYYWRALSLEGIGDTHDAIKDWNALMALPPDAVPSDMSSEASQHLSTLKLGTPSAGLTVTVTVTP
jgi:tetratricopeptide (TPR) repeat protein